MYHAESFAKLDFETYLIGYQGVKPVASLLSLPHVRFLYLAEPPLFLRRLPFLIVAPFKVTRQVVTILYTLLWQIPHPPEFILVQNPPSIPTLALVWLVGLVRGSKVIIDWHNLGYSILALRLGQNHILVKVAKWFEATFGRSAYAHLFVTRAMRDHLVQEWGLRGITAVLHDRPPAHFHRATPHETHELFLRLTPSLPTAFLPSSSPPYSTPLTTVLPISASSPTAISPTSSVSSHQQQLDMPSLRAERPALVVSSTSWTDDEDFSILLDALGKYDARAREGALPKVLVVVTGKGPRRAEYMAEAQRLQRKWEHVRVVSLWLEAEDYPLLLGSADIGVSLHASSSALDLPMKVVDMFGCGLPVCALDFACLPELVQDGKNGLIFKTADQLAHQLEMLLAAFPDAPALSSLRASLERTSHAPTPASSAPPLRRSPVGDDEGEEAAWGTWDENWARVMRPLVQREGYM
ncbi:glycosyltransferase family 33 protein [Auriscalpium vulgare]|uniref:Glycosyltransferase family 33 protein n=1 Tax=Auriscalpium vulgare TaxID=40419 RepID=A0ACB8RI95_9AGAM|nr:glycosyltransferase family 33 protein [Auriscalpium vulgare]